MSSCKKESYFFCKERESLLIEFEVRRKRLEKEFGCLVSLEEAKKSFLDDGLKEFAEGFRMGFCAVCEDRNECGK